jgi:pimeloyl-ACP methyl ester carboxylesterase
MHMSKFLPAGWKYGTTKHPNSIFVGGFGATPLAYEEGIKLIAEQQPLYMFDIINYSGNGYKRSVSFKTYTQNLKSILDEYEHVDTLIGHSMGGGICLQTVLDNPGRIKRLILVNSLGVKIDRLDEIIWRNIAPPNQEVIKKAKTKFLKYFTQAYVNNPAYYVKTMELALKFDIKKELSKIDIPTLIIWSINDELIPLTLGKKLHENIRGSRFITFDGIHMPFQTDPERFAAFWKKHVIPFMQD